MKSQGHSGDVSDERFDRTDADLWDLTRVCHELNELGQYRGWMFTYEYPGYFCYSHKEVPFRVFFTPDWEGAETLPIEVQDDEGDVSAEHSDRLPLPLEGRTGQKIFDLVRPTLDKLLLLVSR